MTSAIRAQREAEDGFTLIELLVVVIIIGILAAIAIPAFLNQRERAWQSELTSAVRNTALEIEAEATSAGGVYPDAAGGIAAAKKFVDDNVNGSAATTGVASNTATTGVTADSATATPVNKIQYDVATAGVGKGFTLCMEHFQITGAHRIRYQGGTDGNGLQNFEDTAYCDGATS